MHNLPFYYLFILGSAGFVAMCGLLIVVAFLIAEHGLWGTGSSVVGAIGSVVVAFRLRCPIACGIFLDQGSNLCDLQWQADS